MHNGNTTCINVIGDDRQKLIRFRCIQKLLPEQFYAQGQSQGLLMSPRPRDWSPWPRTWSTGLEDPRGQGRAREDSISASAITSTPCPEKRCHFIFDYNSRISSWIFIIFIPVSNGTRIIKIHQEMRKL